MIGRTGKVLVLCAGSMFVTQATLSPAFAQFSRITKPATRGNAAIGDTISAYSGRNGLANEYNPYAGLIHKSPPRHDVMVLKILWKMPVA